jgi:hypothetical protein
VHVRVTTPVASRWARNCVPDADRSAMSQVSSVPEKMSCRACPIAGSIAASSAGVAL